MIKNYDIVVIGAGPAGCMFVNSIKKDYSILLLDIQKLPPKKICGGLLTEESIQFLGHHNLTIPSFVFSKPKKLKKIYVNLDKGTEKEQGLIYNIDRNQFNNWMFQLINKNVDILEQVKLKTINTKNKEKITIQLHDMKNDTLQKISCSYLIGADGVLSKVRKELQLPLVNKYIAVQEYGTANPDITQLYFFFSKSFIDHFIWIMPKGQQTICGLPFHYRYGKKIDIKSLSEN
jgi:flavin-dependent dehydrogenase